MNAHVDVAAYALGALSDREAGQFEDHLVGCSTCAAELESMVSVVTMMSDVTLADITDDGPRVVGPYTASTGIPVVRGPGSPSVPQAPPPMTPPARPAVPPLTPPAAAPAGASAVGPGGAAFGGPPAVPAPGDDPRDARWDDRLDERREDRRDDRRPAAPLPQPTPISRGRSKRRTGRVLALAAAAAVVGAVGGGAVVAETDLFDPAGAPATQAVEEPVAPIEGATVSATDKGTGAHLEAALDSKVWGTKVEFQVTKVQGPKACRLVAVHSDGDKEVLSTWTVPDGGYGYEVRPQPLALTAATATRTKDITHLQVEDVSEDGAEPSTLVTVRV